MPEPYIPVIADLHCHPTIPALNTKFDMWHYDPPKDWQRTEMINTSKLERGKTTAPADTSGPKLSDYITSDEGLDFSRFQMLLWTVFALITFIGSYGYYIYEIFHPQLLGQAWKGNYNIFFPQLAVEDKQILPSIDMSFIVLMGLSQGAYIGRKLVPDFKAGAFKKESLEKLQQRKAGVEYQQKQLELLLLSSSIPDIQKLQIQKKLDTLKDETGKIEEEKITLQAQTK